MTLRQVFFAARRIPTTAAVTSGVGSVLGLAAGLLVFVGDPSDGRDFVVSFLIELSAALLLLAGVVLLERRMLLELETRVLDQLHPEEHTPMTYQLAEVMGDIDVRPFLADLQRKEYLLQRAEEAVAEAKTFAEELSSFATARGLVAGTWYYHPPAVEESMPAGASGAAGRHGTWIHRSGESTPAWCTGMRTAICQDDSVWIGVYHAIAKSGDAVQGYDWGENWVLSDSVPAGQHHSCAEVANELCRRAAAESPRFLRLLVTARDFSG